MRRDPALQPLSHDHHLTLVLAQQCMRAASGGDAEAIEQACREAVVRCSEWETHFQAEERWLFPLCLELGGEAARLARQLLEEHNQLRRFCRYLAEGDSTALYGFGALLQAHTRLEERQLFPLLETHLNRTALAQLGAVLAA